MKVISERVFEGVYFLLMEYSFILPSKSATCPLEKEAGLVIIAEYPEAITPLMSILVSRTTFRMAGFSRLPRSFNRVLHYFIFADVSISLANSIDR